ncbi:hypothetical protein C1708_12885 [Streptomyces sp. DH-12]|nr:hypothetical protein C1708_12885 [Streptomyces sp. DH-12]
MPSVPDSRVIKDSAGARTRTAESRRFVRTRPRGGEDGPRRGREAGRPAIPDHGCATPRPGCPTGPHRAGPSPVRPLTHGTACRRRRHHVTGITAHV